MHDQTVAEITWAHADQLASGEARAEDYLHLFPDNQQELAPLLSLAERIVQVLRPVKPDPSFRAELKQGLVTEARQRAALRAMSPQTEERRNWMLGAAAIGSAVSIAGLIAYILRQRHDNRTWWPSRRQLWPAS